MATGRSPKEIVKLTPISSAIAVVSVRDNSSWNRWLLAQHRPRLVSLADTS